MECQKPIVTLRQETGKKKKIRGRRDKLQKGSEVENEERMEKAQGKRYPEDPLCYILQ